MNNLILVAALALTPAYATDGPAHEWFAKQKNSEGQFCCYPSDGQRYDGNYTLLPNGAALLDDLHIEAPPGYVIPANPTGHAIVWLWYEGKTLRVRCFSPGTLF